MNPEEKSLLYAIDKLCDCVSRLRDIAYSDGPGDDLDRAWDDVKRASGDFTAVRWLSCE